MNTIAIIQARMDSSRLKGKVMKPISGKPMIGLLFERLHESKSIDQITLATSTKSSNDNLVAYAESLGISVFRGSEVDVLDRYYQAACEFNADNIVRITADCPLVDIEIVDVVVKKIINSSFDYVSNIGPPTYPDGLDVEVFTFKALHSAWKDATDDYDREHASSYIRESKKFNTYNVTADADYSAERWTVDFEEDFSLIEDIFAYFKPDIHFGWRDILRMKSSIPKAFLKNIQYSGNRGSRPAIVE